MLEMFRKSKKTLVVLLTVMLILPVQQSFAQDSDWTLNELIFTNARCNMTNQQMDMSECLEMMSGMDSDQQADCCDDSSCDPGNCYSSAPFVALFLSNDLINSTLSQQLVFSVEQREISFLPSELFRPPRKI